MGGSCCRASSTPVDVFPASSSSSDDRRLSAIAESLTESTGVSTVTLSTKHVDVVESEEGVMINQYVVSHVIGKGGFGEVLLCFDDKTEAVFALKSINRSVFRKKFSSTESDDEDMLMREIAIMKNCCHPNVVRLFEVIDDPSHDKMYLVMEYISNGPVMKIDSTTGCSPHGAIPEIQARLFCKDLLSGLEYLHYNNIIHRDIKPENLLVDESNTLKISDFGIAIIPKVDDLIEATGEGTAAFLSPEYLSHHGMISGRKHDCWAVGITLYVLLYGRLPFTMSSRHALNREILEKEIEFPHTISGIAIDLLSHCLDRDPTKRFDVESMLRHPWITGEKPIERQFLRAVEVSKQDIDNAVSSLRLVDKVVLMVRMRGKFKKLIGSARKRLNSRASSRGDQSEPEGPSSSRSLEVYSETC